MIDLFNNAIFRLILLSAIVSAIAVLFEFIICKYTKKKVIAYILPIFLLILTISIFTVAILFPMQGMMDIALIVLSIPLFFSSVATFLFAFIYKRRLKYLKK
ncbi:hypothetical protein RBG61_11165 [Paludicola sp. MB14-C6]|uniref:hypothetical protein n=1 Tax=Paludihabitans sp. MB14-C6 TaxID=3070656 RepID=UPI0027DAD401|nr:hypothetical protein [Paludicola sp. MB14-C6]WMJ22544.1 hypothetical protein RBG61_11165 [Paludicola sp. MB14-C6]